jgi:hypothetical protein
MRSENSLEPRFHPRTPGRCLYCWMSSPSVIGALTRWSNNSHAHGSDCTRPRLSLRSEGLLSHTFGRAEPVLAPPPSRSPWASLAPAFTPRGNAPERRRSAVTRRVSLEVILIRRSLLLLRPASTRRQGAGTRRARGCARSFRPERARSAAPSTSRRGGSAGRTRQRWLHGAPSALGNVRSDRLCSNMHTANATQTFDTGLYQHIWVSSVITSSRVLPSEMTQRC